MEQGHPVRIQQQDPDELPEVAEEAA